MRRHSHDDSSVPLDDQVLTVSQGVHDKSTALFLLQVPDKDSQPWSELCIVPGLVVLSLSQA
jgi:hypothetical protein